MGTCPSLNYITDVSNVVTATSSLTSTREQLYHLLFGTALNIIFLRHSNFYHLGTMVEYIDNIASGRNSSFFKDLNCQSITFSKILRDIPQTASDFGEPQNPKVRQDFLTSNPGITVMHSVVQSYVRIAKFTVIEYCLISSPTQIGSESILSNCKIRPFNENQAIVVPSRCCFHTVAIQNEGQIRFVTLVFSIEDDLKWHSSAEHWKRDLTFMNIPLQTVCVILGLSPKHLFHFGCQSFSLWNAKLFPVADTMEESFRLTNSMACKLLDVDEEVVRHVEPECRISMAEILERKNVEKMIEFQENLRQLILSD